MYIEVNEEQKKDKEKTEMMKVKLGGENESSNA
jgi:hypothetical protein